MTTSREPRVWRLENSKYAWLRNWGFRLKVGVAHKATRFIDYQCETRSFAGVLYRAAAARGLKATIAVFEKQGCVVFTFYKPDGLVRPNMAAYPIVQAMRAEEERL